MEIEALEYRFFASRQKIYALIIAIILYLLILTILLIEITLHYPTRKTPQPTIFSQTNQTSSVQKTLLPGSSHKTASPIRFMNQPAPATPQLVPANAPPIQPQVQQPTAAAPPPSAPANPVIQPQQKNMPVVDDKPIPAVKERTIPVFASEAQEETTPTLKARSKKKWFKEEAQSSAQPQRSALSNTPKQQQRNNIFNRQYTPQRNHYDGSFGSSGSAQGNANALEYQLFCSKIVRAICEASHVNPLIPITPVMQAHVVRVNVTFGRNRTIEKIEFIEPSYYTELNDYLKELIRTHKPPKLPDCHKEDYFKFPMKVFIDQQMGNPMIRLRPA